MQFDTGLMVVPSFVPYALFGTGAFSRKSLRPHPQMKRLAAHSFLKGYGGSGEQPCARCPAKVLVAGGDVADNIESCPAEQHVRFFMTHKGVAPEIHPF